MYLQYLFCRKKYRKILGNWKNCIRMSVRVFYRTTPPKPFPLPSSFTLRFWLYFMNILTFRRDSKERGDPAQ